jgi:CRP/FNR family cyclic AMP-dependent transcriptional regulator
MFSVRFVLPRKGADEGGLILSKNLGKEYKEGDAIVRQGEIGDCMFEILDGRVEVIQETEGEEVRLAELGRGDFFGEMAIFDHEVRSATVRALGLVRALTIDKRTLLRRITEDPSLAFRILEKMSHRIRELNKKMAR